MKLLSLWEPWATLMALGAKKIETRSWSTSYRGWLAIQASKGGLSRRDLIHQCRQPEFSNALKALDGFDTWNFMDIKYREIFPFGKIVAVVKLGTCLNTRHIAHDLAERPFGNYEPGRFAWITTDLFRLPEPIPFKAKQGLCDVPDDVVAEIRKQWPGTKERVA